MNSECSTRLSFFWHIILSVTLQVSIRAKNRLASQALAPSPLDHFCSIVVESTYPCSLQILIKSGWLKKRKSSLMSSIILIYLNKPFYITHPTSCRNAQREPVMPILVSDIILQACSNCYITFECSGKCLP